MTPSPSRRLIIRYTLLQLPGIALLATILFLLEQWFDLPWWLHAGVLSFWLIKDVVMFPFVWRAYDWEGETALHSMVGQWGVVRQSLSPAGSVRVGNELWQAEVEPDTPHLHTGARVRVRALRGLTLLVEPWEEGTKAVPKFK